MKVIIVTGLSGAGKTMAMDVLEDMGYYCVDNMPPALIKNFMEIAPKKKEIEAAAFGIDVRGGSLFDDLKDTLEEMKRMDVDYKILYLEATDRVLSRRYSETRREHPMAYGEPVIKGIKRERRRLEEIRSQADNIIDTSNLSKAQMAAEIRNIVNSGKDKRTFTVNIMSFGFKYGMPVIADMMFDARFIPNPYYVKSLKDLTGNNKKVREFVMKHEIAQFFMNEVTESIESLIPYYEKEDKHALTVCFGCTGGQHRSVSLANELNDRLVADGIRTTLEHRDL